MDIIINEYSNKDTTTEQIARLGIIEILTPQRQSGLSNMIGTIQRYASSGK